MKRFFALLFFLMILTYNPCNASFVLENDTDHVVHICFKVNDTSYHMAIDAGGSAALHNPEWVRAEVRESGVFVQLDSAGNSRVLQSSLEYEKDECCNDPDE